MIDRGIGLLGIALAVLTVALQYKYPQLPSWGPYVGFGIGIALLSYSLGLISAGGLRRKRVVREKASLRLHIYGDLRAPDRLAFENIFRWYYLQTRIQSFDAKKKPLEEGRLSTLFVSFEEDVAIGTLTVRSPDMRLPPYEVKDFNQRFAIITFSGHVEAGTLEIDARI
jgi:hypothetical protein